MDQRPPRFPIPAAIDPKDSDPELTDALARLTAWSKLADAFIALPTFKDGRPIITGLGPMQFDFRVLATDVAFILKRLQEGPPAESSILLTDASGRPVG